ncbi:MAG: MOSC domain-containing protein [Paracoccaceae bacterium]
MNAFVTAEALAAALPHVLSAPRTDGPVHILCTRPAYNKRVFPDRLRLTRAGGAEGDFEMSMPWLKLADGSPDPRIQVSILPLRVLDLVWLDRKATVHPGDTIVADLDVSEANLPAGSLIRVGSAVLRVSDIRNDGCAKWKVRYGRPSYSWITDPAHAPFRLRGIFCSIEADGEVSPGDRISKL